MKWPVSELNFTGPVRVFFSIWGFLCFLGMVKQTSLAKISPKDLLEKGEHWTCFLQRYLEDCPSHGSVGPSFLWCVTFPILGTPPKTSMEPEKYLLQKEEDRSEPAFLGFKMLVFRGVVSEKLPDRKVVEKMSFLFHCWDMSVPKRVWVYTSPFSQYNSSPSLGRSPKFVLRSSDNLALASSYKCTEPGHPSRQ